jgi:hypothetical protein
MLGGSLVTRARRVLRLRMKEAASLTLREEYCIIFCMKLKAVISPDNYYSQFYHPSCELVQ